MLKPGNKESVRLTVSPFLKVVLIVIAVALSLIAVQGLLRFGASPLYAQSTGEMDVNIKSIGGWSVSGSIPVEISGSVPVKIEEYPYSSTVKVELQD